MMNCFGLGGDNCCLWILMILLIVCLCRNGCLTGILEKICNCGCLLPVLIALYCCGCKGDKPGMNFGFGCK